ncbi:unnamed protein product [Durusdinium trenchii]|uniref:Uncharacterized protein n=2 Tax=Durusdinium trenchii TaxID=1381693 RepID=A0ABP0KNP9_9DINO
MEDAKVSRIRAPRKDLPRTLWRTPQKRLFLAPAIEATLRQRQQLQPLAAKSVPMLRPKAENEANREELFKDTLTKEKSYDAESWGQEAWLNILTGENRVEIPFNEISAASHGEEYIQWYEDQRAQKRAAAPPSWVQRRGSLAPMSFWRAALTDFALSSLQPTPGELLQLKGRAVLLRHLEANATPQGLKALAECIMLRLGEEQRALPILKKGFGDQMSLLDFAGFCAVLDLDLDLLLGSSAPQILAHLLPGQVTMDCSVLLQPPTVQPAEPTGDFVRCQGKWWLLGRYLGLLALQGVEGSEKSWQDLKLRIEAQLRHLQRCLKPFFFGLITSRPEEQQGSKLLSLSDWTSFFRDLEDVDARWSTKVTGAVLNQAFEKASEEGGLSFESFKNALKHCVEALPGSWEALATVARSAK